MIDLNDLDPDQLQAATAPRGPVCILAGAGTGKTRTITYRIAHLIESGFVAPQRVLAVTFTRRAAGEMRDRLASMGVGGVQALTFHSAAMRQLRYFWPQYAGDLPWRMVDNHFSLVGRAVRGSGLDSGKETVRDLLAEIDWAKSSLVSPDGYEAQVARIKRTPPVDAAKVAEVYQRYESLKTTPDGMLLDFSDLLLNVAGALENSTAISEEFREQYRSFVVDEYQDVSPLQQRVLEAWLGQRDDLTVVGDANQTIYSFNGATPQFLLNFSRTYENAVTVKLQRDYRSTPQITELANEVIGKATGRIAGTRLKLEGMRPDGPEPEFRGFDDEPAEARAVAARIRELLDQGVRASEIAVLYRINAQSQVFEQELAEAGIVYQVRGGEGFFQRAEIRQAIGELTRASRRADLPADPVAIARAAFAPLGLTDREPDGAQARERWQSLQALVDLIEEIVSHEQGTDLGGVLASLRRRADAKQPPVMEGVTLATIHAAKGLEWDAVFVVGVYDGMLPYNQSIKAGDHAIEEERRLFYVAVTRAREHLHVSWAAARQEGGQARRKRTRFLDGVVPEAEPVAAAQRGTRATRCTRCGHPLATPAEKILGRHETCPSDADEEVFAALRAWRAEASRVENVPAYIVFTDAVLMALAEAMPADQRELLNVPGIGPAKQAKYGDDLLAILNQFR
ncbi:ATP-dependent helicase [Corynebacterium guangdongense]|uniref:DNA 3'-5' helicase n=1 Tax=Corynebacterium guangdongense TaxID=1783348 RepID=A0ABU1ZUX5_9CORY|nr:ATP-dependent DNA helicase UvrD2 [Corynebacterium guangdongense]MDR7328724.1 DNA helicase-2/ATP-dependent DNA helicase PcrA [Corynebacterium guangdongense]WJZ17301.1 ATP-dependent DNA helicase UvrD2 [Corynebacterium guangdongense]